MKISIPKPCHENWDEMTPDEKGKFCALCSKSVIDFSKKTDVEVVDFISSSTEENICGNFYPNQLNRNLDYSFLNSFLAKFTVGLMLTSSGWVSVNAQQCDSITPKENLKLTIAAPMKTLGRVLIIKNEQAQNDDSVKYLKDSLTAVTTKRNNRDYSKGKFYIIRLFYILNDKRITEADFYKLETNSIKSIKILKGKEAVKVYGDKARDGAVIIESK